MVRNLPSGHTGQARLAMAMALLAAVLTAAVLSPSRSIADDDDHSDLRQRQSVLDDRIEVQRGDVDEISTRLLRAQGLVESAVTDLATARALLADLEEQVRRAVILDDQMQDRLIQAVVRLRNARADLVQSRQDLIDKHSELASYAVSAYQTGGVGVLSLGLGLDAETAREAVDSVQDSDSILNKQTVALQELQASEVLLELTEERVEDTKRDVRDQRLDAADNLVAKRGLEREAATAKREVSARVQGLRAQRQEVVAAKQQELQRLDELESERERVGDRLRRIAEQRARQHNTTIEASPPPAASTSSSTMIYPLDDTYITSPYGMRMHPILRVYKLHDGTDFGADCGTPVYASADGTVTEAYYNSGYGNRVIIDHGYVKGVSLSTSYNHLTSSVATVGQRVEQGQLIAYAGTTGYSTGCHLHFMVYVNGATVDPLSWL